MMRVLLAILAALACIVMIAVGGVTAMVGFLDQRSANRFYDVAFGAPGDDCGPEELELNVEDGMPLDCVQPGMVPITSPDPGFTGFTREQNDAVLALAHESGDQGVDEHEQQRIQALVDRYETSVPSGQRRIPVGANPDFWGAPLGWTGAGVATVGALGIAAMFLAGRRSG